MRQRALSVWRTDTVPFEPGHDLGRAVKALFNCNHLPAGEALFASSILAEPNKLRRSLHGAHHGVELFQSVRMAVYEHCQIAVGECRLAARDCVQSNAGVLDDPFAVLACDLAMLFEPFRLQPFACHARGGRADLVLGL